MTCYTDSESGAHLEWVYLKGPKARIEERMRGRESHFVPPSLLDSQFYILEEPGPEAIVNRIPKELGDRGQARGEG